MPYVSFGIIADPQFADKVRECMASFRTCRQILVQLWHQQDDGHVEGRVQRHREASGKLQEAVKVFAEHPEQMQCVLVLGDFIEGREDEVKLMPASGLCCGACRLLRMRRPCGSAPSASPVPVLHSMRINLSARLQCCSCRARRTWRSWSASWMGW